MRQFTQEKLDNLSRLWLRDDEMRHPLQRQTKLLTGRFLRFGRCTDHTVVPERLPCNALYRFDNIVCRRQSQTCLAAEMVGNGTDIRLGQTGDLAGRCGVETLRTKQL